MLRLLLITIVALVLAPAWGFDPRPLPTEHPTGIGVGGGYLFGGIGGNVEFRYTPRLSLTAGIGVDGAFVGAHLYLQPPDAHVRYRLTAGVAASMLANSDGTYDYGPIPAVGVGVTWATARTCFRGVSLDLCTQGVAVGYQF